MLISVNAVALHQGGRRKRCSKASPHSAATGTAMIRVTLWSRSREVGGWRKMNSGMTPRALVTVAPQSITWSSQVVTLNRFTTVAGTPATSPA